MNTVLRFRIQVDPAQIQVRPGEQEAGWQVSITGPQAGQAVGAPRNLLRLASSGRSDFPYPADEPPPELLLDAAGQLNSENLEQVFKKVGLRQVGEADFRRYAIYLFQTLIGKENWATIQDAAKKMGSEAAAGLAAGAELPHPPVIELALAWGPGESDLHRLHWEAMHDGERFLASLIRDPGGAASPETIYLPVAVTRLVINAGGASAALPEPTRPPAKVLVAVGVPFNDREIHPAAEFLGLLRHLRYQNQEFNLYARALEKISPSRLQEAVANFSPQVVHLITHGNVERGKGPYVELFAEANETEDVRHRMFGEDLLKNLAGFGRPLPTIVVLSACYTAGQNEKSLSGGANLGVGNSGPLSGEAAGTEEFPQGLMPAAAAAPLAAQLVAGGVPVVVGMSGRVADLACRLFTRGFGAALVKGEPLVLATARARWGAFAAGGPAANWVDWCFPAIFLAENVPSEFSLLDPSQNSDLRQIETWVSNIRLERTPVFCARQEIFQAFYNLFPTQEQTTEAAQSGITNRPVLVVSVASQEDGLGRFRLLAELALQAIRDRHLPLLVGEENNWSPPGDPLSLAMQIHRAIKGLRTTVYNLGYRWQKNPLLRQVEILNDSQMNPKELDSKPELDDRVKDLLSPNGSEIPNQAIKVALQIEMAELLSDARATYPGFFNANSRAVVLLLKVEDYDQALDALLFEKGRDNPPWLGDYGLGDAFQEGVLQEPVPVVMVYSSYGNQAAVNAPGQNYTAFESRISALNFKRCRMGPFDIDSGEDLLAYWRVLLNPWKPELMEGLPFKALTINPKYSPSQQEGYKLSFQEVLMGIPRMFETPTFSRLVRRVWMEKGFLVPAQDEDILNGLADQMHQLGRTLLPPGGG